MSRKRKSFQECIKETKGNKNVLLGNGWSIGLWEKFSYEELLEKFSKDEEKKIRNFFDKMKTTDFEDMMQAIEITKEVLQILRKPSGIQFDSSKHLDSLKDSFLKALEEIHPRNWDAIESKLSEQKTKTIKFLQNFQCCFTTNYDLLLYWILNKAYDAGKIALNDGFATPQPPLIFQETEKQNLFYLHGGLHLHDSATRKEQNRGNESIIEQLKNRENPQQ
ncbi:MAG: DUF4917 family protein [Alphaproteobacteria bacterium]